MPRRTDDLTDRIVLCILSVSSTAVCLFVRRSLFGETCRQRTHDSARFFLFHFIKAEEECHSSRIQIANTFWNVNRRIFSHKAPWGILRAWVDIFRNTRGTSGSPVRSDEQVGNLVFLRHKKNRVNPQRARRLQAQNRLSTSSSNRDISSVTHTRGPF